MSDGPGHGPSNQPSPAPSPAPRQGTTPTSNPAPSGGQILLGIFLILFGLCLTLLGGGCTMVWIGIAFENGEYGGGFYALANPLFLVSLAILAGGIITVWTGVKFLMGRYAR